MAKGCLKNGGAVSVDGVHLKVSGKHFDDFTVRYITQKEESQYKNATFEIEDKTSLLVEGPDIPNASNIRWTIEISLQKEYETFLDLFLKNFTVVTDSASVMVKMAKTSVSPDIHTPYETWMACMAHFLKNIMKQIIAQCIRDVYLQFVAADFEQ